MTFTATVRSRNFAGTPVPVGFTFLTEEERNEFARRVRASGYKVDLGTVFADVDAAVALACQTLG